MSYQIIAQGDDINRMSEYENLIPPGRRSRVLVSVSPEPAATALAQLQEQVQANGVTLAAPVTYDAAQQAIIIDFIQPVDSGGEVGLLGMTTMTAIGVGLGGLAIIGVTVFAWSLVHEASSGIGAVWIVAGIVAVIIFIKSQEGRWAIKKSVGATEYVGKAAVRKWEAGHFDRPRYRESSSRSAVDIPMRYSGGASSGSAREGYSRAAINEEP
jgi:hypothetical protein